MGKVYLIGGMSDIEGWEEVRTKVEKKMKKWPELSDWIVKIKISQKKGAVVNMDQKEKILTLAYQPESTAQPEVEANLIMAEFVDIENEYLDSINDKL